MDKRANISSEMLTL